MSIRDNLGGGAFLDTLEEIAANTEGGKTAGALAVKELKDSLAGFPNFNNIIEEYTKKGTYTIPSDGYLIGILSLKGSGVSLKASLNDVVVCMASGVSDDYTNRDSIAIPVKEGMTLEIESPSSSSVTTTINIKLYGFL